MKTILFLTTLFAFTKASFIKDFFNFQFDADIDTGYVLELKVYFNYICFGEYDRIDIEKGRCNNKEDFNNDMIDFFGLNSTSSFKLTECLGETFEYELYNNSNCDELEEIKEITLTDCVDLPSGDSVEGKCQEYIFWDTLVGDYIALGIIMVVGILFVLFVIFGIFFLCC